MDGAGYSVSVSLSLCPRDRLAMPELPGRGDGGVGNMSARISMEEREEKNRKGRLAYSYKSGQPLPLPAAFPLIRPW